MSTSISPWTGMMPIDDTSLAVTDTGGSGRPVVYLNGSYSSQRQWGPTIRALGAGWRQITFDERARGKSHRSSDYSFDACLRDLAAVLKTRNVERPILVGWSYGAFVAAQWAADHPEDCAGIVAVDGGYPYDWINDENRARIRKLFRRLSPLFPIARMLGLAARMSAADHAEINIELNELAARFTPVLQRLKVPARWIVGSHGSLGATSTESEEFRGTLEPLIAENPNIRVSATVSSNHGQILRKDATAIVAAIHEVAAASARA